jgi:hypothetical protein
MRAEIVSVPEKRIRTTVHLVDAGDESFREFQMTTFRSANAIEMVPEKRYMRIAALAADLLTLFAFVFAALGLWRLGTDLGWAGDFVVGSGFLSHWQVWIGAAAGVQYASRRLSRSAGQTPESAEIRSRAIILGTVTPVTASTLK